MSKKMLISKTDPDPKKKVLPVPQKGEQLEETTFKKAGINDSTAYKGHKIYKAFGDKGKVTHGNYRSEYVPAMQPTSTSGIKDLSSEDIEKAGASPHSRQIIPNKKFKKDPGYLGGSVDEYDENGKKTYGVSEYVLRRIPEKPEDKPMPVKDAPQPALADVKPKKKSSGISMSITRSAGSINGKGQNFKRVTIGAGNKSVSMRFKTPTKRSY